MIELTFNKLSIRNKRRQEQNFNHGEWKPSDWTNAIAGEVGEACNLTKKLKRLETHPEWNKEEDRNPENLKWRAACEAADALIYIDLFIQDLGFKTEDVVMQVFNDKSHEIKSGVFI